QSLQLAGAHQRKRYPAKSTKAEIAALGHTLLFSPKYSSSRVVSSLSSDAFRHLSTHTAFAIRKAWTNIRPLAAGNPARRVQQSIKGSASGNPQHLRDCLRLRI